MNPNATTGEKEFRYRVDIYWRALALYLLVFVGYGVVRSGVANGYVTVALTDPVSLLLLVFVLWTAAVLLWVWYRRPSIVVGKDYVRLRTRLRERWIRLQEMERLVLPRRQRGFGRIRIRLKGRRRIIVVRPFAYERPQELMHEFLRLSRLLRAG